MDPLRPFRSLVRSLGATTTVQRTAGASSASQAAAAEKSEGAAPAGSMESRLRLQLAAMQSWNPRRSREIFVKHVLLSELGENLELDPAFSDLVEKVADQIDSATGLRERLDQVLQDLARGGG